ncbi:FecR domain-containing protein [Gaoshiqia sp. Z1-71]|uniref:FecR domain-containing protein n=1 Tax=Gaoshiqia hydrogeniformans TaxID=3290090 RepID=UPI003BF833CF
MKENFQKYTLDDFLDDPDFCSWARSGRPDMDGFYRQLLAQYPEQTNVFQKAVKLIRLFDDEKLKTDLSRKLEIWEEINKIYREQKKTPRYYRLVLRYAAAIILLFSVGSLTYYFVSSNTEYDFMSSYNREDFTETRLLLDNGKEINIRDDRSEIVYEQKGKQIKINNELVEKEKETRHPVMNQLIVPFGKQAKIVLADRTEVWLNAGSRLVYPAAFDGNKREVQLQGEAFFQVSSDKSKPFIVETSNSSIKVLGTSFNVKAYPDETVEETVLVEGSVSLNLGKTLLGKNVLLKPDERVVVASSDNSYSVSKVNVTNYISWTEGVFVFNDEPLPSVLMRISRFYNVGIRWTKDVENRKISGKLDLKDDFQRVLNALTLISDGNYTEEDKAVFFRLNEEK